MGGLRSSAGRKSLVGLLIDAGLMICRGITAPLQRLLKKHSELFLRVLYRTTLAEI